ncbi:MAG: ribosome recycling factor [bacterium]|nr:ribosome recycling factor [bacterium]
MFDSSVYTTTKERMKKTYESLLRDFNTIRTGRATPSLLDRITVTAYGTEMPLNQVATIATPEARMLTIQPFDKSNLAAIEKAIQKSDLGINPINDGVLIRLAFPPLNEERRKELVKSAKKMTEEAKVAVRNIRRDMIDMVKKMKDATEDEVKKGQDEIQKITDKSIEDLSKALAAKEKEIMEV